MHELYTKYEDYEFTALVAFAILFEAWERLRPSRTLERRKSSKNRDRNLGVTFTVWDRLFGTFVDPRTVEPGYKLGLGYPKSALRMTIGV